METINEHRDASLCWPSSDDSRLFLLKSTHFPARTNAREEPGPPGKEKRSIEKNTEKRPLCLYERELSGFQRLLPEDRLLPAVQGTVYGLAAVSQAAKT